MEGTVLGPILFFMSITDLGDAAIGSSFVRFYANGTKILKHIACFAGHAVLQSDPSAILGQAKRNNMRLHERKFELAHRACPSTSLECLPFTALLYSYAVPDVVIVSPVDELRELGATISAELSLKSQIGFVVATGRSSAAWVLSGFRSREPDVMMILYKTYVCSQLQY